MKRRIPMGEVVGVATLVAAIAAMAWAGFGAEPALRTVGGVPQVMLKSAMGGRQFAFAVHEIHGIGLTNYDGCMVVAPTGEYIVTTNTQVASVFWYALNTGKTLRVTAAPMGTPPPGFDAGPRGWYAATDAQVTNP